MLFIGVGLTDIKMLSIQFFQGLDRGINGDNNNPGQPAVVSGIEYIRNTPEVCAGCFLVSKGIPRFAQRSIIFTCGDSILELVGFDEIDQIQFILEKNINQLANLSNTRAAAMVIHNAVENVAHTAKFLGTEIGEDRLTDTLADMISGFVL